MPDYKVILLSPAREDLFGIAEYHLHMVGPESAERITDQLLDQVDHLGAHPFMGNLHDDPMLAGQSYRKLVCGKYICVYRVIEQEVYIYRIVYGATDYPKFFRP